MIVNRSKNGNGKGYLSMWEVKKMSVEDWQFIAAKFKLNKSQ